MHFFISDCHLSPSHTAGTRLFERFLSTLPPDTQAVYILGDLFDYWVGDDAMASYEQHIATCLSKAAQTTQLYFMPGNRDFLIGHAFLKQAQLHLLPDPHPILIGNTSVLLTHGDRLCQKDTLHQYYRAVVQHPWFQRLALLSPVALRQHIAKGLRKRSKARYQNTKNKTLFSDIDDSLVEKWLAQFCCGTLVHGHIHQPTQRVLSSGNTRIVLGDWHEEATLLKWDQIPELIRFR